jgi:hypothetical protein
MLDSDRTLNAFELRSTTSPSAALSCFRDRVIILPLITFARKDNREEERIPKTSDGALSIHP